jgi:class 3 adenylate cyclase
MIRTVLELDLAGYTNIAIALEEALDVQAVRNFEDQIQRFVDEGLATVGLERDQVVLGTAGDNAILLFESADRMHQFAAAVQKSCINYNSDKQSTLARRWFRMGAATGQIEVDREKRRIIGTTIARAVRLEAAAKKGSLIIDQATYEALSQSFREKYQPPRVIKAKNDERYTSYEIRFVEKHLIDEVKKKRWSLPLFVIGLFVLFGVCAFIIIFANRNSTNDEAPRSQQSSDSSSKTEVTPIKGNADIRVFNSEIPDRNDRPISYPGLLPLRTGERIRLEVRLSTSAYVYLMWIAPSGEIIPVYPRDWKNREGERPSSQLLYPGEGEPGFRMKESVGREVFLAFARSTPLPAKSELKEILTRCAIQLPVRKPNSLVRFRNHELEATLGQDREPDFFLPVPNDDPFQRMADKLNKELNSLFEFVDGMAFASQNPTQ